MTNKERYEANPEKYVVYCSYDVTWFKHANQDNVTFTNSGTKYKLILASHSHIADSIIADGSVEVEQYSTLYNKEGDSKILDFTLKAKDFFSVYQLVYDYRLADKLEIDIPDGVDVLAEPKEEKEVAITRVEVIGLEGREFVSHLKGGTYTTSLQDDGRTLKIFEEPIQKPWHEYENNFPALMYDVFHELFEIVNSKMGINSDHRLATKEEVMALYYEGKK